MERAEIVRVPSGIGYHTIERLDLIRCLCEQRSATEKEHYRDAHENYSSFGHFILALNEISYRFGGVQENANNLGEGKDIGLECNTRSGLPTCPKVQVGEILADSTGRKYPGQQYRVETSLKVSCVAQDIEVKGLTKVLRMSRNVRNKLRKELGEQHTGCTNLGNLSQTEESVRAATK